MEQARIRIKVYCLWLVGLAITLGAAIHLSPVKLSSAAANDTRLAVASTDDFVTVETRVNRFLEEHQKELAALLRPLKDSNPAEYRRAIADLDRVSQRLAETRQRDLARYEWELKRWQIQSRIDLLAARWQMTGGEELKQQLHEALDERYTLNQQGQRLERERLAERLQKLDAQLQASDSKRAETVERELKNFVAQSRPVPKPAASKSSSEKKPSEEKSSEHQSGEKKSGDTKAGDTKSGDKKTADKKTNDKKTADKKTTDKKTTEKKNREKESK
ncbi:MAG: hypothetical protein ACKPEY_08775 [Planctomycetota bacterium]